jgi:hypothetical protein
MLVRLPDIYGGLEQGRVAKKIIESMYEFTILR